MSVPKLIVPQAAALIAAGLAVVLVAIGPWMDVGGAFAGTEPRPVVLAITTEPATLDAQAVNDRHSRVVSGNIFEPLLDRDRTGRLVPLLAESYEAVNPTTWRFRLRRGVKFHNGEPFNAEAAAYSVNRIIDRDYRTTRGSYTVGIAGARAVDEYTVDVLTHAVVATLPIQISSLPMVPPQASRQRDFAWRPMGTGPYRFLGWVRGREMRIAINDDYWGPKPTIREVVVRIIPDKQTELLALRAGEVDMVLDLLPEQIQLAPKHVSHPAPEYSYIAFNTHKREMADPRVRIAMNLAVDKERLARTIYQGHARPNMAQHLSPGMVGFNPNLRPFPYDPARARHLLAEAGFPQGFSVVLNTPIGRYLKGEETSEYVAQQLAQVGIQARVQLHEWTAYQSLGRIPGDRPGAFDLKYGWNSNEWFDGSRIIAHITCRGTSSKICDPRIDEAMTRAAGTTDQRVRDELYQQVWQILNENPYSIYLLQQNLIYGLSARIQWRNRLDDEVRIADMRLVR